MKVLVGALRADQGTIARSGRLGYCPQEPLVYARLTCDEHIDLFGHAYRLTRAQTHTSAHGLYESLVETASAGWAAAFIAGIGMYFQTAATRDTDRRVVIAGLPATRLLTA